MSIAEIIIKLKDQASAGLKAIAGETRTLEQDVASAEGELLQLEDKLQRAGNQADSLGNVAGKAGSNLGKLGGAASLLSPELAGVVRTGADVADVLEVAQVAAGALGVTVTGLMGAVALGVALLAPFALAWKSVADELERVERSGTRAAATATELGELTTELEAAQRGLGMALGGASAAAAQEANIRDKWAEKLRASTKNLQEHKAELEVERAALNADTLNTNSEARRRNTAELARVNAQLATNATIAERGVETDLAAADAALARADAERVLAERQRAAAAAAAEQAAAEAKLQAEWEASDGYQAYLFDLSDYLQTGSAAVVGQARAAAAALKEQEERAAAAAAAMQEWRDSVDPDTLAAFDYSAGLGDAPVSATPPSTPTTSGGGSGGAASAISAVGGGAAGILSLVGSTGMIGSIVSASVNTLSAMGETNADGSNAFATDFAAFMDGLIAALPGVGPAIAQVATGLLRDSLPALVQGIGPLAASIVVDIIPAILGTLLSPSFWLGLLGALIEALWISLVGGVEAMFRTLGEQMALLKNLFSGDFWRGVGEDIVQAIRDALAVFKKGEGETGVGQQLKSWFTEGFAGSYDAGGTVHKTGWALVHEGERYTTKTGANSGRSAAVSQRSAAGGGTNILQVNSVFPPTTEHVAQLDRAFERLRDKTGAGGAA